MKATKVNAGLVESNGRLLLGIWRDSLHVTCGLTACTLESAPGPTLGNEYGKTLPFLFGWPRCLFDVTWVTGQVVCSHIVHLLWPLTGYGDLNFFGAHSGCAELISEVHHRIRPKFHVFGHIHESKQCVIWVISWWWPIVNNRSQLLPVCWLRLSFFSFIF